MGNTSGLILAREHGVTGDLGKIGIYTAWDGNQTCTSNADSAGWKS